ncbi:MAG: TetR family transcriptional regulator [Myxococcota bacterium]
MARARYHHGDLPRALRAAARTLVRRDGAQGFSLRAAAKSAGVDPAAVSRHYRDKQALLDAVAEDGFVELAQAMEDAAARHRKPALKLRAAGEAYLGFAVGAPRLFRLMFDTKRVDPAAVAARTESGKNAYETLLGILEALRRAGTACDPCRT